MRDVFLWVLLPLILAEVILVAPWAAERLLRWGTQWLPEEYQERYLADWVGELDAVPGSLFKLGFAIRVLLSVPATQRALTGRDALWVLAIKRILTLGIAGLLMALMAVNRLGKQFRDPARADAFAARMAEITLRKYGRSGSPTQVGPTWIGDDEQMPPMVFDAHLFEEPDDIVVLRPGDDWAKLLAEAARKASSN
jgi:hypothetical protein